MIHLIWNAKFGGIEKLVFQLAEEQNKRGRIQAGVLMAQGQGEFLEKFQQGNFKLHLLNQKSGFSWSFSNHKEVRQLFKEYDILHFHFFSPILLFLANRSNKKIMYTEHGNFGFGRKKKKSDKLLHLLKTRFLNRGSIAITYNSNFTRLHAEKVYGLRNHKNASVVYNGIPEHGPNDSIAKIDELKKLEKIKESLSGKFVVGTSSRFAGFKRIDRLISAFAKLDKHDNISLLLIGDGALMQDFQAQVKELNIEKSVVFTGYVEEILSFQNLIDVCVFPSESEPFGLVAVEALSIGKPTIVYQNGGGLVEIIEGISKNDVVKNDVELLNRIDCYRNSKQTEEDRDKRMEYAKRFSIGAMANELMMIYQKEI